MSEDALFESKKRKLVIYFAKGNDVNVKNFASRVRHSQNVDTLLVWADKFKDDSNVLFEVAGAVIQHDVPNRDMIAKMYTAFCPGAEVHFMTAEGTLYDAATEEPIFAPNTGADEADTQSVPGEDGGSEDAVEAAQEEPAEHFDITQTEIDAARTAFDKITPIDSGSTEDGTDDENSKPGGFAA